MNGGHNPIIVPRGIVVIEAMTEIKLVDMLLKNMTTRIDKIFEFYIDRE